MPADMLPTDSHSHRLATAVAKHQDQRRLECPHCIFDATQAFIIENITSNADDINATQALIENDFGRNPGIRTGNNTGEGVL